jgi:hypothetical protein
MSRDYIGLNQMKQTPHLPDLPHLAPSDFFRFGYVKGKLIEYRAETPSELLVRIRVILAEIPRETLNPVFLEYRMDGAIAKMRTGRWRVCRMSEKNAIY